MSHDRLSFILEVVVSIICFFLAPLFAQNGYQISTVKEDNHLRLDIIFVEPEIDTVIRAQSFRSRANVAGLEPYWEEGKPALSVLKYVINARQNEIRLDYKLKSTQQIKLPFPLESITERTTDGTFLNESREDVVYPFPESPVQIGTEGIFREIPFTSLLIFPFQCVDKGTIRWIKEIEIDISFSTEGDIFLESSKTKDAEILDFSGSVRKLRKPAGKRTFQENEGMSFLSISVSETGLYRLTFSDLKRAGLRVKNIDPRTFSLRNYGQEILVYVSGESDGVFNKGDYIEFYGIRNPNRVAEYEYSPFTDENVYWLTWGNETGLRYPVKSVAPDIPENEVIQTMDYDYTFHYERNESFERLGYIDTDKEYYHQDHWFFGQRLYGASSTDFYFDLPTPNGSSDDRFNISLRLFGLYHGEENHDVQVFLNGIFIGQGNWNGQQPFIIKDDPDITLRNRNLREEDNELTFIVSGSDPGSPYDLIAFDYLDLTYHRLFRAVDDYIEFHRPAGNPDGIYQFVVEGFSTPDISVYNCGNYRLKDFIVSKNLLSDDYSLKFQDNLFSDDEYIAASSWAIKAPDSMKLDTLHYPRILMESNGYLMIVADKFFREIQPLVEFYSERGMEVHVEKVSNIYNAYSYGVKSPLAIKDYLRDIYQNSSQPPEYVLLVGDATEPGKTGNLIPTMFMQTNKYGAAASDFWYSLVENDDLIPEFHIGRIPCRNSEELKNYLEKRISYSLNPEKSSWKKKGLFIAGYEDDFKEQTDFLIANRYPESGNVDRLLVNPSSLATEYYGGTDSLLNKINRGLVFINFMGHGGGAIWGDRSLFTLDDVQKLRNFSYFPFVASMTCFTGDFAILNSLGESLLKMEDAGVVAFWGSSGVGWIKNDFLLENHLFPELLDGTLSLGEAITKTKLYYLIDDLNSNYLKPSLLYQYNLMGDPAIHLAQPDTVIPLQITPVKVFPGDSVKLHCNFPFEQGFADITVYDRNKYPVVKVLNLPVNNGTMIYSFALPGDFTEGKGSVVLYSSSYDGSVDAIAWGKFACTHSSLFKCHSIPYYPHYYDNISIKAEFINPVDSLICELDTSDVSEYLNDIGIPVVQAFNSNAYDLLIPMDKSSDSEYISSKTFRINTPGSKIAYRFRWKEDGNISYSENHLIRVRPLPDIYLDKVQQGGEKRPSLNVSVALTGADTIDIDLNCTFYFNTDSIFLTRSCLISPETRTELSIPIPEAGDSLMFQLSAVPEIGIKESSTSNNRQYFEMKREVYQLTPRLGLTLDGDHSDTLRLDEQTSVYIPAQAVLDSGVLKVSCLDSIEINQPDFVPVNWFSEDLMGYNLGISSEKTLTKPCNLIFEDDSLSEGTNLICRSSFEKLWFRGEGHNAIYDIFLPSAIALARIDDYVPPEITLSIDGQVYYDGMYISSKPRIVLMAEDRNGVALIPGRYEFLIDGNPPDSSFLVFSDTIDALTLAQISCLPELNPGEKELIFKVQDAAGNWNQLSAVFSVESELRLFDYGNYPNPFKTRTWFVYELTQPVEELRIDIYTVSGRKIATLGMESIYTGDEINQAGYHEIPWDGRDFNSDFVANGVYFYKLVAKGARKTVSSKGAIAKLR